MTYSSPTVRFLFHQLPADKQLEFMDMEERLAKRQQLLHIDAVMSFDGCSEVVIRISFDYNANPDTGNGVSVGKRSY